MMCSFYQICKAIKWKEYDRWTHSRRAVGCIHSVSLKNVYTCSSSIKYAESATRLKERKKERLRVSPYLLQVQIFHSHVTRYLLSFLVKDFFFLMYCWSPTSLSIKIISATFSLAAQLRDVEIMLLQISLFYHRLGPSGLFWIRINLRNYDFLDICYHSLGQRLDRPKASTYAQHGTGKCGQITLPRERYVPRSEVRAVQECRVMRLFRNEIYYRF